MKRLGVFLLPVDGMPVNRRSFPRNLLGFPSNLAGTHLYSWVERGTVRVKCPRTQHNVPGQDGDRTRTARCGVELTNHEATASPTIKFWTLDKLVGGAVASWLVHSTPDRAARVRDLAGDIALCSWARHLTLTVPLFTQVYKWVPSNLMLGVTLRWTSIPSRGE